MKIHLAKAEGQNQFTGYGDNYVDINQRRVERSIVVMADQLIENWPVISFETLAQEHFEQLAALPLEIVLLGSGATLRFPHPRLSVALQARHIGLEVMDNSAACRTYNILMQEGRKVAAALILSEP